MPSSHKKTKGSMERRSSKKPRPGAFIVDDQSDSVTRMRDLVSPSPDLSPRPRQDKLRVFNRNEQRFPTDKYKKAQLHGQILSPLSMWRDGFLYDPKTPSKKPKQNCEVHNLVSSSESESENLLELPTLVSPPKKIKYDKNAIRLPPPQFQGRPVQPDFSIDDDSDEDEEAFSPQAKSKSRSKQAKSDSRRKRGNKKTIVTEEESEEETALKKARPPLDRSPDFKQIMRLLQKAGSALSTFVGAGKIADQNDEDIKALKAQCGIIANELRTDLNDAGNNDGGEDNMDQLYLYISKVKGGHTLRLVKTISTIQCNKAYHPNKVFGFVRENNTSQPLKYAISGWDSCVDDYANVLDSKLWTEEARFWAERMDRGFKKDRTDVRHGKKHGHSNACHVEPRLMTWYACHLLVKLFGIDSRNDVRKQIPKIDKLRKFSGLRAQIVISHGNGTMCHSCKGYQDFIENHTGIEFEVMFCKNLGIIQLAKNQHRENIMPVVSTAIELGDEEDDKQEEEEEAMSVAPREVAVVIRSERTTTTTSSSVVSQRGKLSVEQAPFRSLAVEKAREMKENGRAKSSAKATKRSYHAHVDDDDAEDDVSIFSPQKKRRKSKHR